MSRSTDRGHFFETDAEQAKAARRTAKSGNKYGKPIALKSKILAVVLDTHSPSSTVFVAESAGTVRRVSVDDGEDAAKKAAVYRGPSAPVTSVAVGGPENRMLFAGSWDKSIWSWDIDSLTSGRKYVGHSDFVKAVVCGRLGGKDILISGGADKKIIVWDVGTGARLHTLTDSLVNMMAVQHLVIDPVESKEDELSIVSASSDPHIRRWKVRLDSWEQVAEVDPDGTEKRTVLQHETSVYKLVFDIDGDEVDLWTSSGDGTAKCLSRVKGFSASDDTLNHGDHVRAVAVTDRWIITAGRDEDLKFWDRASGKLYCSLVGHYDEVTDLVVLQGATERLCSVSIDGTIRTWPLDASSLDAQVKEQSNAKPKEEQRKADDLLTAEEEAELAELMDDDGDE